LICAAFGISAAILPAAGRAADWSGEAGLVSDYRYRGVSLSDGKPTLQASLDVELKSGPYAELWLSSIKDEGSGRIEADTTAGYLLELSSTVSLDLSATYYAYPAESGSNALEISAALEGNRGPLTGRLGASFAPPQTGTRDADGRERANLYLFAGANYKIAGTPLSIRAQLGRERGPWDMLEQGSKWDYTMGMEADLERAAISLDVVGSNAGSEGIVGGIALRF
jgi:uncharacterized protein (TIGR02001 family)